MSSRTSFLSRLIGLSSILFALSMLTHKQLTVDTITGLLHNAPLMFIFGLIATIAGVAMVLGHNVWSGGLLPVIVTLIGWATLIKGMLFLFLTPVEESDLVLGMLHWGQLFYLWAGISLLGGVYLAFAGGRSVAR